jgi:hypothetical protein
MFLTPLVWMVVAQVPTVPLAGTVVGPGGEPVVGAELVLVGLPSYEAPVVARGKTGDGGRFSLGRPVALAGDHDPQRAPILWAVKSGFRLSSTRFPEVLPKPDEPVRIVLQPPGKALVRVEGPDGRPLGAVKVLPERLKTHYTTVPDVVAELAAATTGPDGLAVLDAVSPEELIYVDVHSRELGIQGRPIVPGPGPPAVIALRPASSWKGRLTAKDPKHARGWQVKAWTRVAVDSSRDLLTTGYVETTTDDDGRFSLSPIAVGGLQLELKPPSELPVTADVPRSLDVSDRREDSIEIPLKSTVTVTGLFVERGTGKPVPGVSVVLIYLDGSPNPSQTVTTNAHGRYTFQSLPGLVRVGHFRFPPTHVLAPTQGWEDFKVPEAPKVIELATREALPAAPPLHGQVVDEAGRAVPGATIEAPWMLSGGRGSSDGFIRTKADDNGRFVLDGLGPESNVTINARLRNRRNKSPVNVRAGDTAVVTVAITPMPVLAVAGRVLGPGGAPLGGLPVKVQFRVPRDNFPGFVEEARFEGIAEIRTGPDGSFTTPRALERKPSEFRLEVSAPGFIPAHTAWVAATDGDRLTLPDLTLKTSRGVRVVTGRVVDRDSKPVPGTEVSQAGDGPTWTSAKTDGDGRFRLVGVAEGAALVFAEAPGFRFGGTIVGAGANAVEIRVARANEPPAAILKTLPPVLPRAEERALARELLEPLVSLALSGSMGYDGDSVIPAVARVDPARVVAMIENRVIAQQYNTLMQVVLGQFEDDEDSALSTIQDDLDPGWRAAACIALADFRPRLDRARRVGLLERSLADAHKVERADAKVGLLGQIADRWLELGEIERARPILIEGQGLVAAWRKDHWFWGVEQFADPLAAIDLPAAMAIFERRGWTNVGPTDAATINRHRGAAAIRLAGIDPAAAERLIAPASASFLERPAVVLKVSRKMANSDLARARRLVETLDDEPRLGSTAGPALVAFGLGAMAGELAASRPMEARGLLDQAFAGLRRIAVDGQPGRGQDSVAHLMAELLPIVQRLDPDRLAERTWMAAACRRPTVREPGPNELEETFALAMLVAGYDRAMADVIVAAGLERLPDVLADSSGAHGYVIATAVKSLTAYDPRVIGRLLQALPDAARQPPPRRDQSTPGSMESQIRLAAGQILGVPSKARPIEAGRIGDTMSPYSLDE